MEKEAERWWARTRRGRAWSPDYWSQAWQFSELALEQVRACGDLFGFLAHHQVTLHQTSESHRIAGVRMRAVLDASKKIVTLYEACLPEVAAGLPEEIDPRQVVLAHEAFHLAKPSCPAHLAELSAHLFATRWAGLSFFAGRLE